MKLPVKIMLANIGIAIIIGFLLTLGFGQGRLDSFVITLGVVCLLAALLDLFIGIICLVANSKEWGQGLLLSSGALFMLGFVSCSASLGGFH